MVLGPTALAAQAQGNPPNGNASALRFEVTSVRQAKGVPAPGEHAGIHVLSGGQTYEARYVPLKAMLREIYKITDVQIVGGPDWLSTARFDVQAKAEHAESMDHLNIMFENMLADRFKLQFHRETRTLPEWVLSVDKNGPKMKPNSSSEPIDGAIQFSVAGTAPAPLTITGTGTNVDMKYLSWWLGIVITRFQQDDRPVVDQTGLKGSYDFTLTFAPDLSGRTASNGEPLASYEGSNMADALRKQLGLKLESAKGPVEVFVIDHVEKPAEN
jgi:uncharacterized protein (TIGR03435 family)